MNLQPPRCRCYVTFSHKKEKRKNRKNERIWFERRGRKKLISYRQKPMLLSTASTMDALLIVWLLLWLPDEDPVPDQHPAAFKKLSNGLDAGSVYEV